MNAILFRHVSVNCVGVTTVKLVPPKICIFKVMAYLDPRVNMMVCISRIPPFANLLTNQSSLIRDVGLTVC